MQCPNCQREVPKGKRFCGYCGHRLLPKGGPPPSSGEPFDDDAPTVLYATEQSDAVSQELDEQEAVVSGPEIAQEPQETEQPLSTAKAGKESGMDLSPHTNVGIRGALKVFPWISLTILIAGWLIGDRISQSYLRDHYYLDLRNIQASTQIIVLNLFLSAIVIGIFTWYALKRAIKELGWKELIFILVGWVVVLASKPILLNEWGTGIRYDSSSEVATVVLAIALGGLITALALKKPANLQWRHIIFLTLGWTIAAYLSITLENILWRVLWDMGYTAEFYRFWWMDELLLATIGGGIMLWLLTSIKLGDETIVPERQS